MPTRRFFRRSLALSALALLATGTTVALHQVSATPASPFAVSGGATIRVATGTPRPASGTQASLWRNGATATVALTGSGRVVLGAIGDNCAGWPTVRVTVDGKPVGDTTIVDSTRYGSYPVGRAVGAGRHTVSVALVNDYVRGCDRNAHIGTARLETPAAAPAPAPAPGPVSSKPSAANTGVPAGTRLTVHEGDLNVTKDGTVVDGLDIRGFLNIRASNVTVRRTLVRGGSAPGPAVMALVGAYGDHRNFVIEDSTLRAAHPSAYLDGLKGRNFTARRLDISNVVDTALIFGDNVTLESSFLHDTTYFTPFAGTPDNQTHNDNLQIEGGTNIVVRNNVFQQAHNAAIMITQNYSRTSSVQITGNWLSGGNVCTVNLSEKGKGPITGVRLQHNRFGANSHGCAVIAPPTSKVVLDGDVYDATGAPIAVSRGL